MSLAPSSGCGNYVPKSPTSDDTDLQPGENQKPDENRSDRLKALEEKLKKFRPLVKQFDHDLKKEGMPPFSKDDVLEAARAIRERGDVATIPVLIDELRKRIVKVDSPLILSEQDF